VGDIAQWVYLGVHGLRYVNLGSVFEDGRRIGCSAIKIPIQLMLPWHSHFVHPEWVTTVLDDVQRASVGPPVPDGIAAPPKF
jgi:hypothetical protein